MNTAEAIESLTTIRELKVFGRERTSAIRTAIAALRKQEAMPPAGAYSETWEITPGETMEFWLGTCPACGGNVNETFRYCSDCGQKIGWEEVMGK